MICKPCQEQADAGNNGLIAHFAAGCKGITLNSVEEFCVDAARCDCQHRDQSLINWPLVNKEIS